MYSDSLKKIYIILTQSLYNYILRTELMVCSRAAKHRRWDNWLGKAVVGSVLGPHRSSLLLNGAFLERSSFLVVQFFSHFNIL